MREPPGSGIIEMKVDLQCYWQGIDIGSICKVVQSWMFILSWRILDSNSKNIIWQDIKKKKKKKTFWPHGASLQINQTLNTKSKESFKLIQ